MEVYVRSEDLMKAYTSGDWDELSCRLCGTLSESLTWSILHFMECKKQKNKVYQCTACKKTYSQRNDFLKHLKYKHKVNFERSVFKRFECYYCNKIFKHKSEIRNHMEIHMNFKYKCDLCGIEYKLKCALKKHIKQKHLGLKSNKQYTCSFCSKTYLSKNNLHFHESLHKTGRLMCHLCPKTYASEASLNAHIRTSHLKANIDENMVKKFVCDVCGNSFARKCGLRDHRLRQHEGGKLSCKICGKEVYDARSLKIHMNTHTGDKPHSCEICGKSFTTAPYLKVHMYSHTGEAPHVCHLCPQKFRQRSSYTSHYKTHHPGVVPPKLKYTVQEYLQRKHESTSK
uniref:Zinc finger protein 26 n=1 Tax=Cacopsylla melanoneura TaxID=428564 RepID=A0A8D8WWE2_9HEMI